MRAYEYYNGEIGVPAKWLYDVKVGAGLITKNAYDHALERGLIATLRKPAPGQPALIRLEKQMYNGLYGKIIEIAGHPEAIRHNALEELIYHDKEAFEYFAKYRKSNGDALSKDTQVKYTNTASVLKAIQRMIANNLNRAQALGLGKTRMWKNISADVNHLSEDWCPNSLPGSDRKLKLAFDKFVQHGYESIIHGGTDNDNRSKIVGDVADWWLAQYSLPAKFKVPELMLRYNAIRTSRNWPTLTDVAVLLWLNKPKQKRLWTISRHGDYEWTKQFGHRVKRDRSNWFPNSYWAIDGSKLDWVHYYDNSIKMASHLKIDPVVDIFSEKIIGWSYSESESHADHFRAIKMACATAGARPYLLTYDGQSGHTSARMQEMYHQIVAKEQGVHYKHQAYRSSNPIEQILGRFQQQVLNKQWFSDKQGIKSRSADSHPNWEFINKHKHLLKSKEELIKAFEYCVEQWNNMPHPHFDGLTRNDVYQQDAPMREELDVTEMIQIFWVKETTPIKYRPSGIQVKVAGKVYEYEVYDQNGEIDLDFRQEYVGERFQVRYDPDLLHEGIQLWKSTPKGKVFIAIAEPKRAFNPIPALQADGEKENWWADFQLTQKEKARDLAQIEAIQRKTGITPDQLIADQELAYKMGGLAPKGLRSDAEADKILHEL